jgi:hypothetical protein
VKTTTVLKLAGVLGLLATCAGAAEAQIGNLRRSVQRAAAGPSPEIARLLARIDSTRSRFDQATYLLNQAALVMEASVATAERRAEIRRELESAGTLEQRAGDNRVQLNAEDRTQRLEEATAQRRFEQQQLSQQQSANVSAAGFNSALAAVLDARALSDASQLIPEATQAASSIGSDPAMAVYAGRLTSAATSQLPAIVNAVPTQVRLATAIRNATLQARAANQAVQVTEVAPEGAAPRAIDVNAI